jgi:hypothetical protein
MALGESKGSLQREAKEKRRGIEGREMRHRIEGRKALRRNFL